MLEYSSCSCHDENIIWHVCWSVCGKYLGTCSEDKTIKVWSFVEGKLDLMSTLEGHSRTVRCCEFNPDGNMIASASFDGNIIIWEASSKSRKNWDQLASLEGHENEVKSVAWSFDGIFLASSGRDKKVWLWEKIGEVDFECVTVLDGHTQDVKFVKWHPSELTLFSASYDDSIRIWKESGGDWYSFQVLEGHSSTVWGVAISSVNTVVSASADCSLALWSNCTMDDGKYIRVAVLEKAHSFPVLSVDWSKENDLYASCGQDNAIVLSRVCGSVGYEGIEVVKRVDNAHLSDVNCVRWCPTSQWLATCGDDGVVKIWSFER